MQQYFTKYAVKKDERIAMDVEQSHHIAHVMRMREGEHIRIADVNANLFSACVRYVDKEVYADIEDTIKDYTKNKVKITLMQGMIKKDKWDVLLQKCAELGVDTIVPFLSSRCVVKHKEERLDKKMSRWNKILQEGCEQCKRSTLVTLLEPCDIKQATTYKSDLNIIAYEDADFKSEQLHTLLKKYPNVQNVTIAIGCEGGFSIDEIQYFEMQGFQRISLGARILRAETAAMASINAISFFYEMEGDKS